jgi:hypothetical protein
MGEGMLPTIQQTAQQRIIRLAGAIVLLAMSAWKSLAGVELPSASVSTVAEAETLPKVSISNLAGDGQTYNRFYAAMVNSKRYELVAAPAHADLIFELRYRLEWLCENYGRTYVGRSDPFQPSGHGPQKPSKPFPPRPTKIEAIPHITLTVWDRRTNKLAGVYTERVDKAFLQSTADENFQAAIDALVDRAAGEPSLVRAAHSSPGKVVDAPLPSGISAATKVFIGNRDSERIHGIEAADDYYPAFQSAMKRWGRFQLVSTLSDADLVFEIFLTEQEPRGCRSPRSSDPRYSPALGKQMELRVLVPNDDLALWRFDQPAGSFDKTATRLVDQVRQLVTRADRDARAQALRTGVHP